MPDTSTGKKRDAVGTAESPGTYGFYVPAYIALGSNLGDRLAYIRRAVSALSADPDVKVERVSPVYENAAHTLTSELQPDYLNAVAALRSRLRPEKLLSLCHRIEARAGRARDEKRRWVPRTLDLDMLVYGANMCRTKSLTLPHPRIHERRFVLRPLADIAPNLYVPAPYDTTVSALLTECTDQSRLTRFNDNSGWGVEE